MSEYGDCESRAACDEARAELFALKGATSWRPIETAPKDGTVVILFCPAGEDRRGIERKAVISAGSWKDAVRPQWDPSQSIAGDEWEPEGIESYEETWFSIQPTHWMPLPEPPSAIVPRET